MYTVDYCSTSSQSAKVTSAFGKGPKASTPSTGPRQLWALGLSNADCIPEGSRICTRDITVYSYLLQCNTGVYINVRNKYT